jgi:thiamine-phosphate pyrophosphorylase
MAVPVLHVVTDDAVIAGPQFLPTASAVLEAIGHRGALHLRAHATSGRRLYTLAAALAPLAERAGAWLVINDRADVALAAGIQRVQLTTRSLGVAELRVLPGHWQIGASVHAPFEAAAAEVAGASWVIAGNVFETPSHAGGGRGLVFIAAVAGATELPVIAIGGVRPETVDTLRTAGAAGVAVIRGVWDAADAARASIAYLTAYDAGGHG